MAADARRIHMRARQHRRDRKNSSVLASSTPAASLSFPSPEEALHQSGSNAAASSQAWFQPPAAFSPSVTGVVPISATLRLSLLRKPIEDIAKA